MKTSVSRGALYLLVAQVVFMASGYVVHFGLGRLLGPALYGVFGVVLSLVMASNALLISGIPSAVSKFVSEDNKTAGAVLRKALRLEVALAIAVFALYFGLAGAIAGVLGDATLVPYIRVSAFIIPAYALYSLYSGALNGLQFLGKQAGVSIAYSLVKVVSILALALLGFGIYGAIFGYFFGPFVGLLIARYYWVRREGPEAHSGAGKAGLHDAGKEGLRHHEAGTEGLRPHASFGMGKGNDGPAFDSRKLVDFAVPVILFSVAANLLMSIDLFSIKAILKDDALAGYYNAATTLGRIPYLLLTVLGGALFPAISSAVAKRDVGKASELLGEAVRYLVLLSVPAAILMGATAGGLLELFYSARYVPGAQSLSILAVSFAFLTFFSIFTTALNAAGRPRLPFAIGFLVVGLDVVLNRLLIPVHGTAGAAIASTLAVFAGMVFAGACVRRIFGPFVSWGSVLRALVSGSAAFWAASFVGGSLLLLPVEYLVFAAVYFGLLALLGEVNRKDWDRLLRMAPEPVARLVNGL